MTAKPSAKKGGRKPILDPQLVAAAIVELHGNITAVAKRFNVARSSVSELIDKHDSLLAVRRDAREGMIDNAESSLYRAVIGGEAWAVCFFLKTQAKHRGYVEKQIVENQTPPSHGPDLSSLTDDQLRQIDAIISQGCGEGPPGPA